MSQMNIKKDAQKELGINSTDEFNLAILEKQANIDEEPYPMLEVSEPVFKAITKGRLVNSITYGDPGVRVFKAGTMDDILDSEEISAEKRHEQEIRKISAEANR